MSKRVAKQINSFKYKGEPIRITVGTLVLTALCVLFIIVATFTQITLKHPYLPLDTLSFLKNYLGNRSIAVCRELTKLHEDIFRGNLEDAYNNFLENKPRGEFVLVLAGKSESEIKAELEEEFSALTVEEHLKDLINKGMDKKEAIKTVAKMRNIPKKEVYKSAIDL